MTQPMKFASFHLFSQPPWKTDQEVVRDEIDQMVWMDELGYDEVWIGEHNARVASPTSTAPGDATCCSRAAVFTTSPIAV